MDKYGSTFLAWVGIQPIIVSRDPKIAEDILTSPQCLRRASNVAKAMENVLGPGLLSLQGLQGSKQVVYFEIFERNILGTAWIKRRRIMNACFNQNVLLSFLPIFNSETDRLVTQIDTFVGREETDLHPHLHRWSLNIAHRKLIWSNFYFLTKCFINYRDNIEHFSERGKELCNQPHLRILYIVRIFLCIIKALVLFKNIISDLAIF